MGLSKGMSQNGSWNGDNDHLPLDSGVPFFRQAQMTHAERICMITNLYNLYHAW